VIVTTYLVRSFLKGHRIFLLCDNMNYVSLSELGDRNYNADCIKVDADKGIFLLADGAGNHMPAKKASHSAVEYAYDSMLNTKNTKPKAIIFEAMGKANRIREEIPNTATTLDVLLLQDNTCHIGHIGDAKIVRARAGTVEQLTEDHCDLLDELQKYIGTAVIHPDISSYEVQEGDVIAMMSDGVHKVVYEPELQRILTSDKPINEMLTQITNLIQENMDSEMTGPQDNYSIILVQC